MVHWCLYGLQAANGPPALSLLGLPEPSSNAQSPYTPRPTGVSTAPPQPESLVLLISRMCSAIFLHAKHILPMVPSSSTIRPSLGSGCRARPVDAAPQVPL